MPLSMLPPFGLAPMAGMTDTAFRRLVEGQVKILKDTESLFD